MLEKMWHLRRWRWKWKCYCGLFAVWTLLLLVSGAAGSRSLSPTSFKFTQPLYNVSIPESPDTKAYAVPDVGSDRMGVFIGDPSVEARFRIVAGDKRKIFRANCRTVGDFCFLILRPKPGAQQRLNREQDAEHELTIEATVKNTDLVAHTVVHVQVLDRNDLNPLFYPTGYHVEIDEDVALHSSVLTVSATDADWGLNGQIYYSLNEPSSHFAVHPRTGAISVIQRPSVDVRKDFNLTVIAQDRGVKNEKQIYTATGGEMSTAHANVLIHVRRVNRNAPFISFQSVPAFFTRNHPGVVGSLQITDADQGMHGQIASVELMYTATNQTREFLLPDAVQPGLYYLHATPAEITNLNSLQLTVKATDRGIPPRTTWKTLNVSLVPQNEFAPKFRVENIVLNVSENSPVNSFVGQIDALDEDAGRNGQVTYSLITKSDTFRISSQTGWLILLRSLDRETRNIYELEVLATDGAPDGMQKSSRTKVVVKVIDENDNDPLFPLAEVTITVKENEPTGSVVHIASARDLDEGDNGQISYSIANLNELPFEIQPRTGKVRLTRALDYEEDRRDYRLRLRATDSGRPFRRESEMTLLVKLLPKNDNAPFFEATNCTGVVRVGKEKIIATLSAMDADEEDTVSYKLLNDEESIRKCFKVNQSSGDVMMTCVEMEMSDGQRRIALKVAGHDGMHSTVTWLNLTLTDQEDRLDAVHCQPNVQMELLRATRDRSMQNNARIDTFTNSQAEALLINSHTPKFPTDWLEVIHLDEDLQVGSKVLQMRADDDDYSYNGLLRYSAVSEQDAFRVNPSGDLVLARPLDRETLLTHSVNLTVLDCGNPPRSTSKILTVKVLDKNDNAPVFLNDSCSFSVDENLPLGRIVGQIFATDADEGLNGQIVFSISSIGSPFSIDNESGLIGVSGPIDFEVARELKFVIVATDNGAADNRRSAQLDCTVFVKDLNDNAPIFPSSNLIKISVPEDLPVGSLISFVKAIDADSGVNGEIEYAVASENDIADDQSGEVADLKAHLRVDPVTGALFSTRALDFEQLPVFNVTIIALDKGFPIQSAQLTVEVHVEDVDENLHAPRFKDFVTAASVLENQPGDTFVTQVKATDQDGHRVHYSLVGGSGLHLFRMDDEGTIRTLVAFDREIQEHYWLKIMAQDVAPVPKYSILHCYVNIGDVNDNNPMTADPIYYTSVPENSSPNTMVARLEAFDPDSASQLTYKITAGNPQNFFSIDEKTGEIRTTNRKFDRETQAEHTLEVTISDNGEPPLSSVTYVVVAVQDVQDSQVSFVKEHLQRYTVPAWKPPSATLPLFRIIAYDSDVGTNAEIKFALAGKKTENDRYRIDPKSGEVFALQPLSLAEDYNVVIKASDPEDSSAKKTLRIVLEPYAIPPPTTKPPKIAPSFTTQVLENEPVGHMVLLLEAEDPDGDFLWYYIVDGDPDKHFHIGPGSGNLIIARPLDWEYRKNYTLTVNVTDGVHFVSTSVLIKVIDVNEHRPQFLKRTFTASVLENAPSGTEVIRVEATDADEERNVIYSIFNAGSPSSLQKFAIDETSGVITTKEPLDRETTSQHTLVIMVKDRGTNSRLDLAKVLINLIDLNDNTPVFEEIRQPVVIPLKTRAGTPIATVKAFDKDTGLNGELTYSLISSNPIFSIDSISGLMKILVPSETLGNDELAVKVLAEDHGVPPLKAETVLLLKAESNSRSAKEAMMRNSVVFLDENQPIGTFIWAPVTTVPDAVSYELSDSGNGDAASFTVEPLTGILTTNAMLDYERKRKFSVEIRTVSNGERMTITGLTILVRDLNDNRPQFNFSSIVGYISEQSHVGALVLDSSGRPLILAAHDADYGMNSILSFDIMQPLAKDMFEVLPTGAIRLRKLVDYEQIQSVEFNVVASDHGESRLTSLESAKVTINVQNINDCPPVFHATQYNYSASSPLLPGIVLGKVTATDADNLSSLVYKVVGGNADKVLNIDSRTGELSFTSSINESYFTDGERQFSIQVSDGLYSTTSQVAVKILTEASGYRFAFANMSVSVMENSLEKSLIASVSTIGRFFGEEQMFQLLNGAPFFKIDQFTGEVYATGVPMDRETVPNIALHIEATAKSFRGTRVARTQIFVTVSDLNDNHPVFSNTQDLIAIPLNTLANEVIAQVKANDPDAGSAGAVSYTLIESDDVMFSVNTSTGELFLLQNLSRADLEKTSQVTVVALDAGTPSLSSSVTMSVRIVELSVPVFKQCEKTVNVSENAELGSVVTVVSAAYPDGDQRKTVFSIIDGDSGSEFDVDFHTGVVRVMKKLDYERTKSYTLRIRASDPSNWANIFSDCVTTINVLDINDNKPRTKDGATFYSVKIPESTPAGALIYDIETTDEDSGENAELSYTLQWSDDSANDVNARLRSRKSDEDVFFRCGIQKGPVTKDFRATDYFSVDPTSGKIYLTNVLDRETVDQLDLAVIVSDAGHPRNSLVVTLTVVIKDINDNAPCFTRAGYQFHTSDLLEPGKFVGAVSAVDQDDGDEIRYAIWHHEASKLFSVDGQGVVKVAEHAAGELRRQMAFNVSATDGVHITFAEVTIVPVPIINKRSPKFERPKYIFTVAENSAKNTFIGAVSAVDEDSGDFGSLRYSIIGDSFKETFSIDQDTGAISLIGPVDRETTSFVVFWVRASDGGGLSDFAIVNVTISDINDNDPVFHRSVYKIAVLSSTPVESVIFQIEASDTDAGENATLVYSVKKGTLSHPNMLVLDPKTRFLKLKKPIKAAMEGKVIKFVAEVSDQSAVPRFSSVPVELHILPSDRPLPEFTQLLYYISIHEGSPANTTLLPVRVKQPDVRFDLVSPGSTGRNLPFTVSADGRVTVSGELDAEKQNEHRFWIAASYIKAPEYVSYAEVKVRIIDVNDNPPIFSAKEYHVKVPENYQGSLKLLPLTAFDRDHSGSNTLRYDFARPANPAFAIDQESGWLLVESKLDAEKENKYSLDIAVFDNGEPELSGMTTVHIEVIGQNDNAPYFLQPSYDIQMKEEVIPDGPLLQLRAEDGDSDSKLEYYIVSGNELHKFAVDDTGKIFLISPLDREKQSIFELTVLVSDGIFTSTAKVRVIVIDINDNTPTCSKSAFREIIPEDTEPGQVILRLQAADPDENNALEFSVFGDGAEALSMDRNTGVLRIKAALDREQRDSFELLGIASDPDGRSCTAAISILVTDVNDNSPTFPANLTINVLEDIPPNTWIDRLRVRDDDVGNNGLVRFQFLAADQVDPNVPKTFSVDENGLVTLMGQLDREKQHAFDLRVRAKDAGSPALWTMGNVKVVVQNVRDDPPVFSQEEYRFEVREDAVIGSQVGQVEATSADDEIRSDLSYQLTSGNEQGHFTIDLKNGQITIVKELDFEKQTKYLLTVEAKDNSEAPLTGTSRVVIVVSDANDVSPVWSQEKYLAKASEDAALGTQVVQISASDEDSGDNGKVEYRLAEAAQPIPFAVDTITGWVTVSGPLDREKQNLFVIPVQALDKGSPQNSVLAEVVIEITDVNDNGPVFDKKNYSVVIQTRNGSQERQSTGFTVLKFNITDPDSEANGGPFTLEILNGNDEDIFEVNSADSTLRTKKPVDVNKINSSVVLTIQATDSGTPPQISATTVLVRFAKESEFPPKLAPLHISVISPGPTFGGGMIGSVTATDPDIHDILRFDMISHDKKTLFDIDPETGALFAKPGLEAGQYELNISVTDGRFTTTEKIVISVNEVDEEAVNNSVSLTLDGISLEEFVNNYEPKFVRALRKVFGLRRNKDVTIVSVQPSEDEAAARRKRRSALKSNDSVDVLFAVSKGKSGYYSKEELRKILLDNMDSLESALRLTEIQLPERLCRPDSCVYGDCSEDVVLLDHKDAPHVSIVGSDGQSHIYPQHRRSMKCTCQTGFSGQRCENAMPALDDKEQDALSLTGHSYIWYDLQKPIERHLSLAIKFKTRSGAGNLMYVAGRLDYSILEIKHGIVQYRFDCGSGEGVARLEGVFVNDDKWHELFLQRHGRQAEIRLDGKYTASAVAPGINDILNLEGNDAFFGAEIPGHYSSNQRQTNVPFRDVRHGFIGCIKNIRLNGVELPKTGRNQEGNLLQMNNVQWGCRLPSAEELGPCISMPCQNGGRCSPISEKTFSCSCPSRFSGAHCEIDSNPCAGNPCLHGTCSNRAPNDFHCACPAGLTGKRCEYGRFCNPNPCLNGGCEEGTFGPICQCLPGYEGARCERDINECLMQPCQNGGLCENLLGTFRCNCTSISRGSLCEELIYVPNTFAYAPNWGWLEILIIVVVIIVLTAVAILSVVCRKKIRKRRAQVENYIAASPGSGNLSHVNNLNNDSLDKDKVRNKKISAEDFYKRGSKISNLDAERMGLSTEHSMSSLASTNRGPILRNYVPTLAPPPPSCSASSTETMSNRDQVISSHPDGDETLKPLLIDVPTDHNHSSSASYPRVKNRRNHRDDDARSYRTVASAAASVGVSDLNSDDEDTGVGMSKSGAGSTCTKDYYWDGNGTALAEMEDSCAAATTLSADAREINHVDGSDSYGEEELEEDTETTALFAIHPPVPYQDENEQQSAVGEELEYDDDYISNPRVSKRFSDYIPTAELDLLMEDMKENYAELPRGSPLAKMDSELALEADIPPPMQTLGGYDLKRQKYASVDALMGSKDEDEENMCLLGDGSFSGDTLPAKMTNGHSWNKPLTNGNNSPKPLSSVLGKQTQV